MSRKGAELERGGYGRRAGGRPGMPDCNWFHCWWSIETPKEQTRRGRVSAAATWLRVASRPRLHEREKHPDNYAYFHIPLGVWHGGTLGSRPIEATKASRCWQLALIWVEVVQGGRGETAFTPRHKTWEMAEPNLVQTLTLEGSFLLFLHAQANSHCFVGGCPRRRPAPGFHPNRVLRPGRKSGAGETLAPNRL